MDIGGANSDSPCPWEANGKHSAFTHWLLMDIGGANSDSPCPWEANGKHSAFTHWLLMDIGGSESAAPWGDTPIRPAHGRTMESASPSLIGPSWTSADRSPPLRANSAIANRHGEVLGSQDLRLADFETRVRPDAGNDGATQVSGKSPGIWRKALPFQGRNPSPKGSMTLACCSAHRNQSSAGEFSSGACP
jgi:hypothetical protein